MTNELLNEVLERYQTPLYAFHMGELSQTIQHIRSSLPDDVSLCFAMKANPFVVGAIAREVDRIEACSTGEVRILEAAGVSRGKMVVSGVYKDPGLLLELIGGDAYVGRYTVESRLQFELMDRITSQLGVRIPILIRLTSGNQFGLDEQEVRDMVELAKESPYLCVCGIQYYAGTQNASEKRLRREVARLDELLADLKGDLDTEVCELEYGAGLPIEYYTQGAIDASRIEEAQLGVLGDALASMRFGGKVIVELGRSMVAPCGVYATSVVDVKRNDGYNYAIVDGGRHQISYFGNGMSFVKPPCRVLGRGHADDAEPWNVCGTLCTVHDILVKQMPCDGMEVGDVVVFEKAGAYCMTEGISLFLSQSLPRVVLVNDMGGIAQTRNRTELYPLNGGERQDGEERQDEYDEK